MVLGDVLAALFDLVDELLAVLVVDDGHDDARRHDEVEERDDHVEARVEEAARRVVDGQIRRVVCGDHHQESVENAEI